MRISEWSSDWGSSDRARRPAGSRCATAATPSYDRPQRCRPTFGNKRALMTASSFRFGIFRPFGRSSRRRLPLALAGLAVLAGCAGEPESRPCPQAVVLNDASRQVKFNGQGRDLTDVLFEASLSAGRVGCEYVDHVLDVDLPVEGHAAARPGPRHPPAPP